MCHVKLAFYIFLRRRILCLSPIRLSVSLQNQLIRVFLTRDLRNHSTQSIPRFPIFSLVSISLSPLPIHLPFAHQIRWSPHISFNTIRKGLKISRVSSTCVCSPRSTKSKSVIQTTIHSKTYKSHWERESRFIWGLRSTLLLRRVLTLLFPSLCTSTIEIVCFSSLAVYFSLMELILFAFIFGSGRGHFVPLQQWGI